MIEIYSEVGCGIGCSGMETKIPVLAAGGQMCYLTFLPRRCLYWQQIVVIYQKVPENLSIWHGLDSVISLSLYTHRPTSMEGTYRQHTSCRTQRTSYQQWFAGLRSIAVKFCLCSPVSCRQRSSEIIAGEGSEEDDR